jgi:hypothetical protein
LAFPKQTSPEKPKSRRIPALGVCAITGVKGVRMTELLPADRTSFKGYFCAVAAASFLPHAKVETSIITLSSR